MVLIAAHQGLKELGTHICTRGLNRGIS